MSIFGQVCLNAILRRSCWHFCDNKPQFYFSLSLWIKNVTTFHELIGWWYWIMIYLMKDMLYNINWSQVKKIVLTSAYIWNFILFFFIHSSFFYQLPLWLNNMYTFSLWLHTSVKKTICTRVFINICMSKYIFIAEYNAQGKLRQG